MLRVTLRGVIPGRRRRSRGYEGGASIRRHGAQRLRASVARSASLTKAQPRVRCR
jgi:hypothetical protein